MKKKQRKSFVAEAFRLLYWFFLSLNLDGAKKEHSSKETEEFASVDFNILYRG